MPKRASIVWASCRPSRRAAILRRRRKRGRQQKKSAFLFRLLRRRRSFMASVSETKSGDATRRLALRASTRWRERK